MDKTEEQRNLETKLRANGEYGELVRQQILYMFTPGSVVYDSVALVTDEDEIAQMAEMMNNMTEETVGKLAYEMGYILGMTMAMEYMYATYYNDPEMLTDKPHRLRHLIRELVKHTMAPVFSKLIVELHLSTTAQITLTSAICTCICRNISAMDIKATIKGNEPTIVEIFSLDEEIPREAMLEAVNIVIEVSSASEARDNALAEVVKMMVDTEIMEDLEEKEASEHES